MIMQQKTTRPATRAAAHIFQLRLKDDLYERIENEVAETGATRTEIIRRSLMSRYGLIKSKNQTGKESN